jgi:MFS family permease
MNASLVRRLWVVMVTAFVDMIGFALVLPLLPLYARELGAGPFTIGVLVAGFAFGQLTTSPRWGRLSDRIGRRPVIIIGQCFSAMAFLIFAASDSIWLLLLSRLAQGAGGGTLSAAHAYVADAVEPRLRANALGWITAATSAGVMIGPAIGSLSVRLGTAAPGIIAAGFCVLNVLFALRWLPETRVVAADAPRPPRLPLRRSIYAVLRQPMSTVHSLIWIYAAGIMSFMAVAGMMALYLSDRFGITMETIGAFYVLTGTVSVVMRALILGILVHQFGEFRVMRIGAAALTAGMLLPLLATDIWQFAMAIILIPTGTALLFPSTTSLISRFSDPEHMGHVLGVQQAFGATGRLLAPIWAGAAYQHLGPRAPFLISACLLFVTLLFCLTVHRPALLVGAEGRVG